MLGTLCVPSSGETRALLSSISVNLLLTGFSTGKRVAEFLRNFWDVFFTLKIVHAACLIQYLMHGSLRVKW